MLIQINDLVSLTRLEIFYRMDKMGGNGKEKKNKFYSESAFISPIGL